MIRLFLSFWLVCLSIYVSANEIIDNSYKLATDDVLSLSVFNEPDLNVKEAKVSQDGTISIPLLGQVAVANKTLNEAQKYITELYLADYLKQPRVTLNIVEFRPFYINGEVDKPGSYPYRTGLTVQMAITIAGGFTERASRKEVLLFSQGTKQDPIKVDLGYEIKPGDVITVEESFF